MPVELHAVAVTLVLNALNASFHGDALIVTRPGERKAHDEHGDDCGDQKSQAESRAVSHAPSRCRSAEREQVSGHEAEVMDACAAVTFASGEIVMIAPVITSWT